MIITKIGVVKDTPIIETTYGRKLTTVLITYKVWFKEKTIKAYPTLIGPTYGGEFINYFYFTDELGERLDCSEQINSFLDIYFLNQIGK